MSLSLIDTRVICVMLARTTSLHETKLIGSKHGGVLTILADFRGKRPCGLAMVAVCGVINSIESHIVHNATIVANQLSGSIAYRYSVIAWKSSQLCRIRVHDIASRDKTNMGNVVFSILATLVETCHVGLCGTNRNRN